MNIVHSENYEDPEILYIVYFQEEDPTFFDFPETQVGGFGPLDPPETDPPLDFIPSP